LRLPPAQDGLSPRQRREDFPGQGGWQPGIPRALRGPAAPVLLRTTPHGGKPVTQRRDLLSRAPESRSTKSTNPPRPPA
jgi:hypothetical protein